MATPSAWRPLYCECVSTSDSIGFFDFYDFDPMPGVVLNTWLQSGMPANPLNAAVSFGCPTYSVGGVITTRLACTPSPYGLKYDALQYYVDNHYSEGLDITPEGIQAVVLWAFSLIVICFLTGWVYSVINSVLRRF